MCSTAVETERLVLREPVLERDHYTLRREHWGAA
jgi:hypothetical protein